MPALMVPDAASTMVGWSRATHRHRVFVVECASGAEWVEPANGERRPTGIAVGDRKAIQSRGKPTRLTVLAW